MATEMKERTREEFLAERKGFIGGSDISSVMGIGDWACRRKLVYDKTGVSKDFDDSDRPEFRRGHRLEAIARAYYEEKTGRKTKPTGKAVRVPGKQHLGVNMDAWVWRSDRKDPGYLEIKVVGRETYFKIKREGLHDAYILQLQYGIGVSGLEWGSFAIYWPDGDELLHWDHDAEPALIERLLEEADDCWVLNIEHKVLPSPLEEGAKACETCAWAITCRGNVVLPDANRGIVSRPDLEGLITKFAEIKGMSKEATDAAESLREEIIDQLGGEKAKPGIYRAGKFQFEYKISSQRRFSSEALKKEEPDLYEKFRKETTTRTVTTPKEI